jgi:hypothetical protein
MATKHQKHIYMPNEIFEDMKSDIDKAPHIAFSYSYYYLISYLYRYCEYEGQTQSIIKEKLGYNPKEKRVDYLIKKDGVLDKIGYTQTTTNYPIGWYMDEDSFVQFETIDDYKKEYGTSSIISDRNFKVKYPVKMFHRSEVSLGDLVLDGTLYDVSSTHKLEYKMFQLCMSEEKLGTMAFYIYGWLKHKTDVFGEYAVSGRKLAGELGMSEPTLFKYTKEMEDVLIKIDHRKFVGEGGEVNRYRAL